MESLSIETEETTPKVGVIQTVFKIVTEYLNEIGIDYATLNMIESAHDQKGFLGIVITKSDFKRISDVINKLCKEKRLVPIQKISNSIASCLFVFSYKVENELSFAKVQFQYALRENGFDYFSAEELLDNRYYSIERDCWIIKPAYLFVFGIINIINERDKDVRTKQLHKYWTFYNNDIKQLLKRFFNDESIKLITALITTNQELNLSSDFKLLQNDLRRNIRKRIIEVVLEKVQLFNAAFHPPGLMIGILGRDGSGKSTVIAELIAKLETCFNNTVSFKKLPAFLYKGAIFNKNEKYHFSKPHIYEPRGKFASFLKLHLLFVEFMLAYWCLLFPFKRKASLILYDRYFTDVCADPLRYRIKGNKWLARAFHYILPKPDVWIILDMPTGVLLQRKQELTYNLSEKLRIEYQNLQILLENAILIDNSKELNNTLSIALAFIIHFMNERFITRNHNQI